LFYASGAGGTVNTAIPLDFLTHDSYFVVGHFHLILMGTISMTFTGMVYYMFPLITGRMYKTGLAKIHFVLTITGVILTFSIMHMEGLFGMPRRVSDYLPLEPLIIMNQIATTGAWMIGLGYILFAYNLIKSAMFGKPVKPNDPFELNVGKEYYYDYARRDPHH
jgi:cytochrome c oxidase subunit 1